eukprot:14092141-Alexandrium_andersonii.AAC.1
MASGGPFLGQTIPFGSKVFFRANERQGASYRQMGPVGHPWHICRVLPEGPLPVGRAIRCPLWAVPRNDRPNG